MDNIFREISVEITSNVKWFLLPLLKKKVFFYNLPGSQS